MTEEPQEESHRYIGNRIPVFIKIVWFILIIWIIWYMVYYAAPDFKYWITK